MTEEWKQIQGFDLYEVSNLGAVRSKAYNRLTPMKQYITEHGYRRVTLRIGGSCSTKFVHQLVAKAFIPNPKGYPLVNHIDRNRQNNSVQNLEWATHLLNNTHLKGICPLGSSPLSKEDVRSIFIDFHVNGKTVEELVKRYSVIRRTITGIVFGRTWKQLTFDLFHLNKDRVPPPSRVLLDQEVWRRVRHHPDYLISNYGKVISFSRENEVGILTLKLAETLGGYLEVVLNKKRYAVHRLVATHFLENPKRLPLVHHIDGNKVNNRVDNLQWCDNAFNIAESFKAGRQAPRGNQHHNSKLTEDKVREIRRLFDGHEYDYTYFAKRFNVSKDAIVKVIKREYWKHVT